MPRKLTPDDIEFVLFGDVKKHSEKDTEVEKKLFEAVSDFLWESTPRNKEKAYQALKQLSALKKYFPHDLVPKAKTVYRGTKVDGKVYKLIHKFPLKRGEEWYKIPYTYKPKSKIQSWTTNKSVAERFSINFHKTKSLSAILSTTVDDSFIMNSGLMNIISGSITGFHNQENEIIRINAKPIKVMIHINASLAKKLGYHNAV